MQCLLMVFFCAMATYVAADTNERDIYQLPGSRWIVEVEKERWLPDTIKFIFSFLYEYQYGVKAAESEEMGFLAQKKDRSGFFCFAELKHFDVDFPYVGRFDKFIAAISEYTHTHIEGPIDKKEIFTYATSGKCVHDFVGEGVWKFIYSYPNHGKVTILFMVSFDKQNPEAFFETVEHSINRIE